MTEVILLSSAEAGLQERYAWLEDKGAGLEMEFDADVQEAVEMLSRQPAGFSRWERTCYRCYRLLRWNFGLFYSIEGGRVIVVAAEDLRQNPQTIRRKLGLT